MSADDWRKPYRTMDASGTPDSAMSVGRRWIEEEAEEAARLYGPASLEIDGGRLGADGASIVLYRMTDPIAVATVFRDPVNFAILVRWRA